MIESLGTSTGIKLIDIKRTTRAFHLNVEQGVNRLREEAKKERIVFIHEPGYIKPSEAHHFSRPSGVELKATLDGLNQTFKLKRLKSPLNHYQHDLAKRSSTPDNKAARGARLSHPPLVGPLIEVPTNSGSKKRNKGARLEMLNESGCSPKINIKTNHRQVSRASRRSHSFDETFDSNTSNLNNHHPDL